MPSRSKPSASRGHEAIVTANGSRVAITPRTLRSQALDWLREALISGYFTPGQRVNEVQLAAEIGVSRGTLREALRNLEQEGVLESIPHRGMFVRRLSATEVSDVYELLAMVEGRAARRAAGRLTTEDAAHLADLLDRFERLHADPNQRGHAVQNADLAFHEAICVLSGSVALLSTWRALRGSVMAAIINVGERAAHPVQDPHAHRELLRVLTTGGPAEVERTFRDHLLRASRSLVTLIQP